jgi:hypothetical protein
MGKGLIIAIIAIILIGSNDLDAKRVKRRSGVRKSRSIRKVSRRPASVRTRRVQNSSLDFDDFSIEGQNKKSSVLYFLEQQSKDAVSKVKLKNNFREEILESL